MTTHSLANVSDRDLIDATLRAATDERRAIVELLSLLGEVDARRLYLSEGYSSLFAYCTRELKFSEHEAYHRIEAARTARTNPVVLDHLRDGRLTLTSVTLLRPHLTPETADSLIASALDKTKREVEQLVAEVAPKPDVQPMVRRLPQAVAVVMPEPSASVVTPSAPTRQAPAPRSTSAPLSSDRYLLRVTLSAEAHSRLQRARELMRHSVPNGDPAEIVERALAILVTDLERRQLAQVKKPRLIKGGRPSSRHVPAATRREVWVRDGGRCAFVGRRGRCSETAFLEFHHVDPFALGGETSTANLELRCRAHNQYEGSLLFGSRPKNNLSTRPGPS